MTFFWQNPVLVGNPRVKKWVKDLLSDKSAVERAIKQPLRDVLGCGHWGCVVDSSGPWVVKLTIDPNEAPIWKRILGLLEEERYGQGGIVRVKGIYQLEPGVMYGGRKRRTYAIVREAVEPAFKDAPRSESGVELTDRTKQKIKIPKKQRARLVVNADWKGNPFPIIVVQDGSSWRTLEEHYPVKDLTDTVKSLLVYRRLADEYHQLRKQGWYATSPEATMVRIDRVTNSFYGHIGGAVGETLSMLVSNRVVLRDVHLFNVGWRSHRNVGAGFTEEDKTLVIFDPGHTPADRAFDIPVVRVQNPVDEWTWFTEEKR